MFRLLPLRASEALNSNPAVVIAVRRLLQTCCAVTSAWAFMAAKVIKIAVSNADFRIEVMRGPD